MEVLCLIRKGKKNMLKLLKIYVKKKSIFELVKKEKEICTSFADTPLTAKVRATVCQQCLVKAEKALNL